MDVLLSFFYVNTVKIHLKHSFKTLIKIFPVLLLALFVSPSYAAETFTFIEYSTAFSLGLSLPLIIIAFIIRERIANSWWYLILLGSSLLYLLISIANSHNDITVAIYVASACFMFLLSLLPKTGCINKDAKIPYIPLLNCISLFFTVSFIGASLYKPNLSLHYLWAIYTTLFVITSFIRLNKINNSAPKYGFRHTFLWGLIIAQSAIIFMHPHWHLSNYYIVTIAIASYLIALMNYSWYLTSQVTERVKKEAEEALQPQFDELKSLSRDVVTNLPSQAQALKKFIKQTNKQTSFNYAVITFKPVNFNKVNQTLGHKNSDLLLLQLAYCLQQYVENNTDLINFDLSAQPIRIARLPSLQFMIILNISNTKHAPEGYVNELCRQLSSAVPEAISFKSFSLNFELAYGIDFFNQNSNDIKECLACSCDALMAAEKNQQAIHFYNHQSSSFSEQKLLMMERLKQDLSTDNLVWHIQPQINIHTKQIFGFEMTVLWRQENGDLINLHNFIDIVENSGEIFHLVKLMIEKACQVAAKNKLLNISTPITIDFASVALFEDIIVEFIEQKIAQYQLSVDDLIIEIPESLLAKASEHSKRLIDQLHNSRIGIAIDNFSGSYESLRYLRKLAVNQVKVDCSQLLLKEERLAEKSIINALVNLAQVMNIPLVGTNINSASTEQIYNEIGGQIAQGNIISPSIDINEIESWLKNWLVLYDTQQTEE